MPGRSEICRGSSRLLVLVRARSVIRVGECSLHGRDEAGVWGRVEFYTSSNSKAPSTSAITPLRLA
jgi:hypothetical protein